MNARGYIRIRTEGTQGIDWRATCRLCADGLMAGDWTACMEFAHGHLAFTHQRPCEHEYGWHPVGRPEEHKCLDCGIATPAGEGDTR